MRFNDEEHRELHHRADAACTLPALPDTDPVGDVFAGNKQIVGDADFSSTTPRVSITYDWLDNVMVYASYAEGFGAGGINVNPVLGIVPYGPEELSNYEIGLRSDWWNGNVRVNATAFDSEWEGIQLSQAPPDPNNPGLVDSESDHRERGGGGRERRSRSRRSGRSAKRGGVDASLAFLDTAYTNPGDATQIQLNTPFAYAPEHSYSIGVQHTAILGELGPAHLARSTTAGWTTTSARARFASRRPRRRSAC